MRECGHSIFDACRDPETCTRQCSAKIEIPADRPMYSPWLLQAVGLATALSMLLFVVALTAAIVERGAENWRAVALANQEVAR